METRSLNYFIAVAEEKNIGRAASRLHITQPALTRQIHALEDEVGVPLFTRTTTGMEITPAGTALLRHARTIQIELEQAKLNAKQAACQERVPFDIGVYGSAIFDAIPRILGEFSKRNPNVELRLHNVRKDQQVVLLRQGKIQIAFDRFLPQEPDFAYELVQSDRLHVALHRDHPLAAREIIDINELAGEPRVGASLDSEMVSKLAQIYGGSPTPVSHRADNILTALVLVSCGLALTFAPPSIHMPNVVYRPCSESPKFPFNLLCMYRKDDQSMLIRQMLETIRAFRAAQGDGTP
ncbi:LysR family transcriptional regulator [Betaproteobacteria bacterium]|nr:LysR family transcriptional regulator [Betaproteobacteria bacterium]